MHRMRLYLLAGWPAGYPPPRNFLGLFHPANSVLACISLFKNALPEPTERWVDEESKTVY